MGDSITHGAEGDFTWRYRLWQWLQNEGVTVNFVGPCGGTHPSSRNAKIVPPAVPGETVVKESGEADGGPYAGYVISGFSSGHFAIWGRQAAQVFPKIGAMAADYEPEYLLVMLGFNDLSWYVSGPEGTLGSMEKIIRNAQAVRPNIKILVANVPQRTLIPVVNEGLPVKKTTD